MFEKTKVLKRHADPLYQTPGTIAGEFPEWNFINTLSIGQASSWQVSTVASNRKAMT